jgi:endonuclease-8
MPEGDTIHRVVDRLRPALAGQRLVRLEVRRRVPRQPAPGTRLEAVTARGKHVLIAFDGGLTLRTHLGMHGSWQLHAAGEPWRRPAHLAREVVEVDGWEAVCFSAPTVALERVSGAAHVGPDLCEPDVDLTACVARMDGCAPDTEIGDVLSDQRVAGGIGNVYKSEICFACGIHPRTRLRDVDTATRYDLMRTANQLLVSNLGRGPRTTTAGPPGSVAVYQRQGERCRRCGARIEMARTGPHRRVTYWCPDCQARPQKAAEP